MYIDNVVLGIENEELLWILVSKFVYPVVVIEKNG